MGQAEGGHSRRDRFPLVLRKNCKGVNCKGVRRFEFMGVAADAEVEATLPELSGVELEG